jgi:hypothetical protein
VWQDFRRGTVRSWYFSTISAKALTTNSKLKVNFFHLRSLCSFSLVIAEVGSFYPVGWANIINLKMLMLSFVTFAHLTVTWDLLFVWQDFRRGTVRSWYFSTISAKALTTNSKLEVNFFIGDRSVHSRWLLLKLVAFIL